MKLGRFVILSLLFHAGLFSLSEGWRPDRVVRPRSAIPIEVSLERSPKRSVVSPGAPRPQRNLRSGTASGRSKYGPSSYKVSNLLFESTVSAEEGRTGSEAIIPQGGIKPIDEQLFPGEETGPSGAGFHAEPVSKEAQDRPGALERVGAVSIPVPELTPAEPRERNEEKVAARRSATSITGLLSGRGTKAPPLGGRSDAALAEKVEGSPNSSDVGREKVLQRQTGSPGPVSFPLVGSTAGNRPATTLPPEQMQPLREAKLLPPLAGGGELSHIWEKIERAKEYPRSARARGLEGQVTVRFRISPDGSLADAVVQRSSGSSVLDGAALRAVRRAAPFPYVDGWLIISISFQLSG